MELPWYERRANFLTQGIDLRSLVGKQVRLGDALVEILEELEPCARMLDIHERLYEVLEPDFRGGVFGRILENGYVKLHSPIKLHSADALSI